MEKRKSLIKAIVDIYRVSQAYISPRTSEFGVSRGQWYFLNKLLLDRDGISQEALSKEMNVDRAHTTRAIKALEDNGFVYRETDSNDGRRKNVYVTEKSLAIKDDYHSIYKSLNRILTSDFSQEETELIRGLLYRMRDNISDYMEDEEIKNKDIK